MKKTLLLTSVLTSGLAFAQSDVVQLRVPPPGDASQPRMVYFNHSAAGSIASADFVRGEFGSFATVKGAPYSADATTESVQVLQDGNRIVHKDSTTLARDGVGRTRRDISPVLPGMSGADAPKFSFLFDPTTSTSYTLNHNKRTVNKMTGEGFNFQFTAAAPAVIGDKVSRAVGGGVVASGVVSSGVVASHEGTVVRRTEHTETIEGPALTTIMRDDGGENANSRVEQLGKQVMEGVAVEGTRNVTTIPVGQIGNERPIEIVNERWYSTELQMVVMSKHSDPRQGETTYRLTNIRRTEPDKSLFEVPAGYTMETEEKRGFRIRRDGPKE